MQLLNGGHATDPPLGPLAKTQLPATEHATPDWNVPASQSVHFLPPLGADLPPIHVQNGPTCKNATGVQSLYTPMTSRQGPFLQGLVGPLICAVLWEVMQGVPVVQTHQWRWRTRHDPNRCEVNEMFLKPITRRHTAALSHTHDESTCKTTPEETELRVPPGVTGNQGPPAGRPQREQPRSTPPVSGRRCRWGCASWPA